MAFEKESVQEASESPYVGKFLEFFESNYKKEIERLAESYPDKRSLNLDFNVLEQFDIELADALLDTPDSLLDAAREAIEQVEVPSLEIEQFSPHIRFFNLPKAHEPLVRDISASQLGKLISVEGVVREITTVMPKLKAAVWKCRHCGNTYRTVQDEQSLKTPSFCECRHRDFDLVPENSEFVDSQRIRIQEPLEKLKGNEQPSTLDVFVSDDLVNMIAAGDKTRFVGVLRLNPPDKKKTVYGRYLEAMHLEETQREFEEVEVTPEEEAEIKKLASDPNIYEMLTKSIAPAIYGHDNVKESIILQLFGGVKKDLPGDQKVRGNVHVLLVGDPGTGKSQILQHADKIAPRSIYTAGKTTSLHPNEPIVLRENGKVLIRNIGEFVDGFFDNGKKEIVPLDKNVEALCMNQKTLKVEWKPIKFAIRHKTKEDLYKFTFETGREITVTGSHSLFNLEDGEIGLKEACKLSEGDCALCPSKMPVTAEVAVDLKMAKLLGYYLADGHTNENVEHHVRRIGFTLNASETDIVEDISDASIKHFGKDPCVYAKGENGLRVTIYGKEPYAKMKNFLGNAFGLHAREKRVPNIILNATEEERNVFLDAYFAGDAGVTKSKYLMSDLQYLFLENSIIASQYAQLEAPPSMIGKRQIFSEGETYRLNAPLPTKTFSRRYSRPPISKMPARFRELFLKKAVGDKYLRVHMEKLNNKQLLERLLVISHFERASSQDIRKTFGKNSLQYFRKRKTFFELKRLGRICQVGLTKTGQKIVSEFLKVKKLLESDLGFIRIKKIEKVKFEDGFVYDVSVPGNESFVGGFGGVICHNSGVGLTASAVKDDFGEGGWTLKAGALVLSSGGICMVDEMDKMEAEDRSAMHEAMEQGMISVAKAGIVTRFRSDTSILAAANPKMSRFEQYTPFIEQINLPASLISRFDLFFMIKDVLDRTRDEAIAAHILSIHAAGEKVSQYKKKGKALTLKDQEESISATPIISTELLGKYISYARQKVFPILCADASHVLHDFYIGLRDIGRKEGSYAATHRQLEGLVRLSEASARVRLSDVVEKKDAERAIKLVKASLGDLVTDPETGKIDYDIIMTGQTHTQVTHMREILSLVRKGVSEGQDMVPLQDVLNQAEGMGINKEKAKDLISKLEKNGELYRPRHNFLKPTQKD